MSPFWVKVCNRLGLLKHLRTKTTLLVNGTRFTTPLIGMLGINNLNLSEQWMINVLEKLKPLYKGYFTDIGINIGQTLLKAYGVYGTVNYVGFEPNPTCVYYVQELVKLNKIKNCNIIPVGINDRTGVLQLHFYIDNDSDPSASIVENFRPGEVKSHSLFIPVFDHQYLQTFLPQQQNSLLKIDVEGAEPEVLQGLSGWIQSYQPVILVEILPVYESSNVQRLERQQRLEHLMKSLNYRLFRVVKTDTVYLLPLNEIGIHGNLEDCDYILCPEVLCDALQQCFST